MSDQNFQISLIGHEWAMALLQQQHQAGRVAQSLLITGPPNIGKTTLARYFAQYLNCLGDSKPCGACRSCRKVVSGNHPDVRILDETESLKIDSVRGLLRELSLSPVEGENRVAIISNFERATTSAANALLKTLEEPAPQVVIILTAVEPGGLLPTIVSRCQVLKLRPLPSPVIRQALQEQWQVDATHAELLTQLAAGRLGWAVNTLVDTEFLERRTQRLGDLLDLLKMHRAERLAYAQELSRDTAAVKEALALWLIIWRDLLLLKSGSQTKITNLDWQAALQQIAHHSTLIQINQMITGLQQAYQNLERNVNPRLNLEVVLLKLPRLAQI